MYHLLLREYVDIKFDERENTFFVNLFILYYFF